MSCHVFGAILSKFPDEPYLTENYSMTGLSDAEDLTSWS